MHPQVITVPALEPLEVLYGGPDAHPGPATHRDENAQPWSPVMRTFPEFIHSFGSSLTQLPPLDH